MEHVECALILCWGHRDWCTKERDSVHCTCRSSLSSASLSSRMALRSAFPSPPQYACSFSFCSGFRASFVEWVACSSFHFVPFFLLCNAFNCVLLMCVCVCVCACVRACVRVIVWRQFPFWLSDNVRFCVEARHCSVHTMLAWSVVSFLQVLEKSSFYQVTNVRRVFSMCCKRSSFYQVTIVTLSMWLLAAWS